MSIAKKKSYYPWVIAILGFFLVFFSNGTTSTSFSAVSAYLYQYWGLNNTVNAVISNCRQIAGVVVLAFAAAYHEKFSYRWGISMAMAMGAVGWICFWLASADRVWLTYLGGICIGICRGLAGFVPCFVLINRWFVKHKALVIGICSASTGIATAVMPTILKPIVEKFSLQTYFLIIVVMFLVVTAIGAILLRDTPESIGVQAWGEGENVQEKKKVKLASYGYLGDKRIIALLYIAAIVVGLTHSTYGNVNTLTFTTAGWDAADAALVLANYGLFLMIFKVIYGALMDRIRKEYVIIYSFLACAIGSAILVFVTRDFFTIGLGITSFFIWAIGGPLASGGFAVYASELSSKDAYPKVLQFQTMLFNISGIVFTQIFGLVADIKGNYVIYDAICVVLNLVAMAITLLAFRLGHKNYLAAKNS